MIRLSQKIIQAELLLDEGTITEEELNEIIKLIILKIFQIMVMRLYGVPLEMPVQVKVYFSKQLMHVEFFKFQLL